MPTDTMGEGGFGKASTSSNKMAVRKITEGWSCTLSNRTRFRAYHRDHEIIAHNSTSIEMSPQGSNCFSRRNLITNWQILAKLPEDWWETFTNQLYKFKYLS